MPFLIFYFSKNSACREILALLLVSFSIRRSMRRVFLMWRGKHFSMLFFCECLKELLMNRIFKNFWMRL